MKRWVESGERDGERNEKTTRKRKIGKAWEAGLKRVMDRGRKRRKLRLGRTEGRREGRRDGWT